MLNCIKLKPLYTQYYGIATYMPIVRTVTCLNITSYFTKKKKFKHVGKHKNIENYVFVHEETPDFPTKNFCYKILNM